MTAIPIVCLGSSAGGLTALIAFFKKMAPDCGKAFIVIQHLKADVASLTPEILSHITSMPVTVAKNGESISSNRVYVIPSNTQLTIKDQRLHVAPRTESPGQHKPFDRFLASLARNSGKKATAIILSGYDGDGARGFVDIKAHGGTTYAQDQSAEVDQMPQHAMATGCVDHVMSPSQIADHITQQC